MKRNRLPQQPSRTSTSASKARIVHISDYFAILREHKWIAVVPFLIILGGAVALTLLATPVYQADSMLAIDTASGATGLLGELQLTDGGAKVEAEMEIMRSQRVAVGAAAILAGEGDDNPHVMGDFLIEVNRYRPLDILTRIVRKDNRPAATVELECEALPAGVPAQQFQFRFLDVGAKPGTFELEVAKIKESRFGSDRASEMIRVASGKMFTAFDHDFTLNIDGNPVGRLYKLTLRSKSGIARWLRSNTVISQLGRNTGIIALGCTAETPRLARAASLALARSFEGSKQRQKETDAGRALEFLKKRADETALKKTDAERKLAEFVGLNGVTFLSEKAKALVEVTSSLEREAMEYELRLEEQERALAGLQGNRLGVGDITHYVDADPTAAALAAQLAELEVQYDGLTEELTDEMPQVKNLKTRIKSARERLRSHLITRAESAVRVTKNAIERIAEFSQQKQDAAKELPNKERELATLTHKVRSLEAISAFLLEKKNEVEIAKEAVFSNVRIVDEPLLPSERVSPNLIVNFLVGLFLASIAALATAFFAEYLDQSIKSPEDLERALDLPLYAALPAFKSVKSKEVRKLKTPMVTIAKPHSTLAEGYRSLRANIRFADFESPVRAFAITSAVLGEGKTTTSLNLAVVLAQAGSKVMVVDADLRRPATHAHLNGTLSPGLTDILLRGHSWRSVVRPVAGVENLEVIHAGAKPANPGALLDSKEFLDLVEELKTHYEYILFDVPPVLAVSDAASFFHKLDALFLLVQWRRCPIHVVQAAKDQAIRLGANLRGVIFNGFDARKSARRGYGHYGYYGYYGYYGKNRGYGYVADEDRKGKRAQTVKK